MVVIGEGDSGFAESLRRPVQLLRQRDRFPFAGRHPVRERVGDVAAVERQQAVDHLLRFADEVSRLFMAGRSGDPFPFQQPFQLRLRHRGERA
ncbi:hypothetical protein SDC9_175860 [bioreactor metagenome]|uniref:Uncharacterized protein n=1 Tax=bioreactor metagenome TaxID=1076179 RepID=A0A645GRF7_9ZZZZ